MFQVTFQPEENMYMNIFDQVVEGIFWLDLFLNFFHQKWNFETNEVIEDLKGIARNYIFKGSFFIDFISVFPFKLMLQTGGLTRLLRLFRLPRLGKLVDINKVSNIISQLMKSKDSRDEKITAKYTLLYYYKLLRLIIIAMIITYFIGCFWFYFCNSQDLTENNFITYHNIKDLTTN